MISATCSHNQHAACEGYVITFARGKHGQAAYRYADEPCDCCARGHQPTRRGSFGGSTYSEPRDGKRLNRQAQVVFDVIKDGNWHTLRSISEATNEPEASISARLRDLRKPDWGGYDVKREFVSRGLWKYRLTLDNHKQP